MGGYHKSFNSIILQLYFLDESLEFCRGNLTLHSVSSKFMKCLRLS